MTKAPCSCQVDLNSIYSMMTSFLSGTKENMPQFKTPCYLQEIQKKKTLLEAIFTVLFGEIFYYKTGKYTCKTTCSRIRVTIFAAEKQQVFNVMSVCLCFCFIYPACRAHAPCYTASCGLSGSFFLFSTLS